MVEAGAKQVPEDKLLEALEIAHREIVKLCEAQEELRAKAGKPKWLDPSTTERLEAEYGHSDLDADPGSRPARRGRHRRGDRREGSRARSRWTRRTRQVFKELQTRMSLAQILEKQRSVAVEAPVREQFENDLRGLTEAEQDSKELKSAKRNLLFTRIVETVELPFPVGRRRVEPRRTRSRRATSRRRARRSTRASSARRSRSTSVAPTAARRRRSGRSRSRSACCPRTHGSGLFTRGQTQIMTLLTLGTAKEGQRIDDLSLERDRRYMHHYNFPPYSVGETGRMGSPKRRDIGHGALAQRALEAVIPPAEDFPYTIRLVSETLESNGSSSMGSVCGSTLALMDAGVPITAPVSGIAMGLVKEGDDYVILTDIQGAEDHLGDMDFKVAGTQDGITALQMDIKITGVSRRDHGAGALAGEGRPHRHPREDARGDLGAARRRSPSMRRGSRRSRSTRSSSAW